MIQTETMFCLPGQFSMGLYENVVIVIHIFGINKVDSIRIHSTFVVCEYEGKAVIFIEQISMSTTKESYMYITTLTEFTTKTPNLMIDLGDYILFKDYITKYYSKLIWHNETI